MTTDEALSLLRLKRGASEEEIKRAFRTESQKYHPDLYATQASHVQEVMREKFQQIAAARDLLMRSGPSSPNAGSRTQGGGSANADHSTQPDIEGTVERVRNLQHQRRFRDALQDLDTFMNRFGLQNDVELLSLRVSICANGGMHQEGVDTLQKMRWLQPTFGQDIKFLEALALGQTAARQFDASLNTLSELEALAGYSIPLYLQRRAETLIMAGRIREAEQVIQRLAQVDPSNPLVRERGGYLKVGNNYVGKKDAVAGGCALCAILELIFDCL